MGRVGLWGFFKVSYIFLAFLKLRISPPKKAHLGAFRKNKGSSFLWTKLFRFQLKVCLFHHPLSQHPQSNKSKSLFKNSKKKKNHELWKQQQKILKRPTEKSPNDSRKWFLVVFTRRRRAWRPAWRGAPRARSPAGSAGHTQSGRRIVSLPSCGWCSCRNSSASRGSASRSSSWACFSACPIAGRPGRGVRMRRMRGMKVAGMGRANAGGKIAISYLNNSIFSSNML